MNAKVISATLLATAILAVLLQRENEIEPIDAPTISARRISPPVERGAEIVAAPSEAIEFVYEIVNNSNQTIRDLQPRLTCRCQVVEEPPAMLRPGDACRLAFRLRGPTAGRLSWKVLLEAENASRPLAVLEPTLVVPVTPPIIRYIPERIRWTTSENQPSERRIVVETIESAGSKPWLEGWRFDTLDVAVAQEVAVDDRFETDETLAYRTYSFDLSLPGFPRGEIIGTAVLRAHSDGHEVAESITPYHVSSVPETDIQPRRLVFRGSEIVEQRVVVIRRGEKGTVTVEDPRVDGVDVVPLEDDSGRVVGYRVSFSGDVTSNQKISFLIDGLQRISIDLIVVDR